MSEKVDLNQLSRAVSQVLRHDAWRYDLEMDDDGWVSIDALVEALQVHDQNWASVDVRYIEKMIDCASKKRHELSNGRVRALYGHSLSQKLQKEPRKPPLRLYHGTSPVAAAQIAETGLRSMNRQNVHLSTDLKTAKEVGRRKCAEPTILVVNAEQAYQSGIPFYRGSDTVWLADHVPAEFVKPLCDAYDEN